MINGHMSRKIAYSCPKWESIQAAQGFGLSLANSSMPSGPRCEQCIHWQGGTCEIFLAKSR